jgi:ferredoxin-like protein FixX
MSNDMIRIDNTIMYLEVRDKGEIKHMNKKKLIAKFTVKNYKAIPNDGDIGFDHLINLSCVDCDIECVPNLVAERGRVHQRMEEMQKTRDIDLWIKDLEELQQKLAEKTWNPKSEVFSQFPTLYLFHIAISQNQQFGRTSLVCKQC